jgi:hypothetical protein
LTFVLPGYKNLYKAAIGRILEVSSEADFVLVEGRIVLIPRRDHTKVIRIKRLQDDTASSVPSASAARHLSQELKGSLSRPKVWEVEGKVGAYDAHQGDVGIVMSLCHHLSPYKDIDVAFS